MRALVTGAAGSIGSALVSALSGDVLTTDRDSLDVTDAFETKRAVRAFEPTVIFHLAGAKHAPLGEEDPWEAAEINICGTRNVLEAAADVGARVVTASTCKACNPETAYGATKLIAERMTLNAGGSVARFYNVRESSGNVFELWRAIPEDEPIPVTPCSRRFMSIDEAVNLLLRCAVLPSGRYTVAHAESESMETVARQLYPGRALTFIPPRRGDRLEEPAWASQERAYHEVEGILRIVATHDLEPAREALAA
jgi:FlaA1/EpsC-like NDP-sugar epimerase